MALRTTRAGAGKSSAMPRQLEAESHHDDKMKKVDDDMDIFGAPVGSDEEETKTTSSPSASPLPVRAGKKAKFSPPRPISAFSTTLAEQETFTPVADIDDLFQLQPKKKKRKVDYAAARRAHHVENDSSVKFTAPAALEIEEESSTGAGFKPPSPMSKSLRRGNKNASKQTTFSAPPAAPTAETTICGPKFRMPTGLDEPDSSAPSLVDTLFDVLDASQESPRKRSGSTSSLSSHSSIDMKLTLAEQHALTHDDTDSYVEHPAPDRCDLCHSQIEISVYLAFLSTRKQPLKYRAKEKLCLTHQTWTAQRAWTKNNYPNIHWPTLESNRIPKHIPHLTAVLARRSPSLYLAKLDSIVIASGNAPADQKTSRKALHDYLREGVIHVAKQGYYGPRGARVMGHAVTTLMADQLKAYLRVDKVARAAGVGGYVTAVLVPELMVQLVKEDMDLGDEEALRVLEQSSKAGALLNADDDEVVGRDLGD